MEGGFVIIHIFLVFFIYQAPFHADFSKVEFMEYFHRFIKKYKYDFIYNPIFLHLHWSAHKSPGSTSRPLIGKKEMKGKDLPDLTSTQVG